VRAGGDRGRKHHRRSGVDAGDGGASEKFTLTFILTGKVLPVSERSIAIAQQHRESIGSAVGHSQVCTPIVLKSLTVAEQGLPPAAKSLRATADTGWAATGAESAGQTASAVATTSHSFAVGLIIGVLH
jgi:hypothetical protein